MSAARKLCQPGLGCALVLLSWLPGELLYGQVLPLRLSPVDRAELRRELELVESIQGNSLEETNAQRAEALAQLFRESADEMGLSLSLLRMPVHKHGDLSREPLAVPNVVVSLPGRCADAVIVVGAHLDKVGQGHGAIDDWSGCIVLQNLWQQFSALPEPPEHTFLFVCFAYEESGLWGSQTLVNRLRSEGLLNDVQAMVNLECLGVSSLQIWRNGSSPELIQTAEHVAQHVTDVSITSRDLEGVGADSVPFFNAGIPAITVDSLEAGDFGKIHSPQDRLSSIHNGLPDTTGYDRFEEAFRFGFDYLTTLDGTLSAQFRSAERRAIQPLPLRSFHPHGPHGPHRHSAGSTAELPFQAVQEAVDRANRQWEQSILDWGAAAERGDHDAVVRARILLAEVYTADGVVVTPEGQVIQGRERIVDSFSGLAQLAQSLRLSTVELEVSQNGLAYERGAYRLTLPEGEVELGTSYVVWRLSEGNGTVNAQFHLDTWRPDRLIESRNPKNSQFQEDAP